MAIRAPFHPDRGSNQVVTPAAASASVNVDKHAKTLRLVNTGANLCHVRVGAGAQTATTGDTCIRANSEIYISKGDGDDTVAYISATGTTLHIQVGEGGY